MTSDRIEKRGRAAYSGSKTRKHYFGKESLRTEVENLRAELEAARLSEVSLNAGERELDETALECNT